MRTKVFISAAIVLISTVIQAQETLTTPIESSIGSQEKTISEQLDSGYKNKAACRASRSEKLFGGKPVMTAVKLSLPIVVGIVNPSVEFRVHKHFSVAGEALGCFYPNGFGSLINGPATVAMAFLEARYFPIETFHGFFVGPNIGYGVWRLSKGIYPAYWGAYPNEYQVGSNFMAGLTIGYHFTLAKHWGLELSWGGGYSIAHYEGHQSADGSMFVAWNGSHEWFPAYKAAFNIVYKW